MLRIPAGGIELLVTNRMRQWLVDPGSIYQATRLSDPATQRRLIARAAAVGRSAALLRSLAHLKHCLPQRRSSAFDETGVAELLHTAALNIIRRAISATIKTFPFR